MAYPKIAQLKSPAALRSRLDELGLELPLDERPLSAAEGSPLAGPLRVGPLRIGNRWCIHPMEGWDANHDGSPSELTLRRWQRFGYSGAKLLWGGEAAAVRPDGRANPNQTMAIAANEAGLVRLRETALAAHRERYAATDDLVIGLQLTHSGRYCKPHQKDRFEPRIAYHHPLLDRRVGVAAEDDSCLWSDAQLDALIGDYVAAAQLARRAGFDFVDIKACHGYLLHELLSARSREGRYGGDLAGRARMLLETIRAVRSACPELTVGVRLSLYDTIPFEPGAESGRPAAWEEASYRYGFGCDPADPLQLDLQEPLQLIGWLREAGVAMLNLTCGSPYYCPHIQRPAIFPPSDGYAPPEDPLCGVARQIHAVRTVKAAEPELPLVGSGYTYLQEYVPHVAQAVLRAGWVDSVGLGRMVLSYPELPGDALDGTAPPRKLVCRTFSDCTTGPRLGMVSGCYPLDAFYKARPERARLVELKKG
jgi:2,4-dienoyl-CoA reductase-like NADH-dependent reductase (Old Yellow Enzyme family)